MANITSARTAQWPLVGEFIFNYNDTMKDTSGVLKSFGATVAGAPVGGTFLAVPLPPGSVLVSGEVIADVAFSAATTISVGTAAAPAGYLAAAAIAAAGVKTPLVFPAASTINTLGDNVVIVIAGPASATAGKARVRVTYTIDGKSDVVQVN